MNIKTFIHTIISYITIIFLMLSTTKLTEQRWAETDVHVAFGGICITLCGVVFSILKRRMQITMSDAIIFVWILYYLGRAWFGNEFPCRTEFLKTLEMALLYYSLRLSLNNTKVHEVFLIALIVAGGCYEALSGAMQIIEGSSRHPVFAVTGNFQNPGPYSAHIMLGLVVGVTAWLLYKNKKLSKLLTKCFSNKITRQLEKLTIGQILVIFMMPMCVILPATWSRAAFFSIAVIVLWLSRQYYWKYRYAAWGILFLVGCGFYFIKQGSADSRMIIWQSSIVSWLECPWFGVGIGGFCIAFAEGMSILYEQNVNLSSAGVTDNAYNILVKILVEQGIVGAMIAITLSVFVLTTLYKNSKPLFYGILSLLLFSMFSYPFDLLPYKIITVIIVAWSESTNSRRICELGRVKMIILSCLLLILAWQTYKLVEESYEADKDYAMIRGFHDQAFIKDYYELLPLENDNPEFLFDFGKILREHGRYNDSNAALYKGTRCSADPMFYVLIGNNYRDMSQYELAEESYYKAFNIMPNRIYPLFQLMMMYKDNDEIKKAEEMAKRLLSFKPKIESPATQEMKQIAIEIMHDKRGSRKSSIE